jgi:hypothetical protein
MALGLSAQVRLLYVRIIKHFLPTSLEADAPLL